MRKALLARYDVEDLMDLAILHKKDDDVIPSKKKECPNGWEMDLHYITIKMEKAGKRTWRL
jgi:hypothetical protein